MAVYALGALPLAFVLYAAPIYLHQALGLSQAALGLRCGFRRSAGRSATSSGAGSPIADSATARATPASAALFAALALGGLAAGAAPSLPGCRW